MNSRLTIILILIISNLITPLKAQEKWTLNQCIQYGIKNNLQLHNSELNEKMARQSLQQSKWNLLPSIGAGSDASRNFGKSIDPNTNGMVNTSFFNNSYYLSASMDLFHGFMLQNQIRYWKFKKDAAEYSRISAGDDLAFEIMTAFFDVLYYRELLKIAGEQKELSELNVKKTRIMVTSGLKAQTELLDVLANFERDELAYIRTSNEIESSMINLKKAMNLPSDRVISLADLMENPGEKKEVTESVDELFNLYSAWSPKLRFYENEWIATQKDVAVRKGGYLPSLRLQASYNTGYYETNQDSNRQIIAFHNQMRNNQRQFIGASLSIPVFNKNAARFSIRQSRIVAAQAQNRLNEAKQSLFYEIEQNYIDLKASIKELGQSERQMQADRLSFQAAQKKFDQGMINVVEFYVIKNQYAGSSGQVLHSRLTMEIRKRMIGFYKGERFWEKPEDEEGNKEKGNRKNGEGERRMQNGSGLQAPTSGYTAPIPDLLLPVGDLYNPVCLGRSFGKVSVRIV